jgi:hypothetical protein
MCAVVFASGRAAHHGRDPDYLVVMNYSAGGIAALMAGYSYLISSELMGLTTASMKAMARALSVWRRA